MLDRVKADHATGDGLSDAGQHVLAAEHLQQPQHLDELAFTAFGHARFDQATQRREFLGQGPADQWRRLVESADLAFEQSQVMQRVEDKVLAFIGAWMTGDHRGSTGDHHLMDIAADDHFPVAIGDSSGGASQWFSQLCSSRRTIPSSRGRTRSEWVAVCGAARRLLRAKVWTRGDSG